jgi:hypothetical protein
MGGKHGTPGLADENNTLAVKRPRNVTLARQQRGALGGTYYE